MIEVTGVHRMRVQFDAAKVYDPGKSGRVIDHDFFGSSAGRERQSNRTQPGRSFLWRALLIKRLRLGPVDEKYNFPGFVIWTCCPSINRILLSDSFATRQGYHR